MVSENSQNQQQLTHQEDLRKALIEIAQLRITNEDPSHDLGHAFRVLKTAEQIAIEENADMDVIIPAALFHDLVNHPKNDPRAMQAPDESADETVKILENLSDYPKEKLPLVHAAIKFCSFLKGVRHDQLEAQIIQDADGLEATGAISIMRTFATAGTMKSIFYNPEDPFCSNREPESLVYAVDLFYARLLKVQDRMYTEAAKKIAQRRTDFLRIFLEELKLEIEGK